VKKLPVDLYSFKLYPLMNTEAAVTEISNYFIVVVNIRLVLNQLVKSSSMCVCVCVCVFVFSWNYF